MSDPNQKRKPQASFLVGEANSNTHGEGYFCSSGNQARTQSFKKISFQGIPELNIYMLVSLHFTWMTEEYRLAAVCIRHVQECNRNQRPPHISQTDMSKERPQGG